MREVRTQEGAGTRVMFSMTPLVRFPWTPLEFEDAFPDGALRPGSSIAPAPSRAPPASSSARPRICPSTGCPRSWCARRTRASRPRSSRPRCATGFVYYREVPHYFRAAFATALAERGLDEEALLRGYTLRRGRDETLDGDRDRRETRVPVDGSRTGARVSRNRLLPRAQVDARQVLSLRRLPDEGARARSRARETGARLHARGISGAPAHRARRRRPKRPSSSRWGRPVAACRVAWSASRWRARSCSRCRISGSTTAATRGAIGTTTSGPSGSRAPIASRSAGIARRSGSSSRPSPTMTCARASIRSSARGARSAVPGATTPRGARTRSSSNRPIRSARMGYLKSALLDFTLRRRPDSGGYDYLFSKNALRRRVLVQPLDRRPPGRRRHRHAHARRQARWGAIAARVVRAAAGARLGARPRALCRRPRRRQPIIRRQRQARPVDSRTTSGSRSPCRCTRRRGACRR